MVISEEYSREGKLWASPEAIRFLLQLILTITPPLFDPPFLSLTLAITYRRTFN